MVTELQLERAFEGQTFEQAKDLENILKQRYEISDWESEKGKGYEIIDKEKDKKIYFSPNSRLTLETRYFEKNNKRKVCENALDLFARVAVNIADADLKYDSNKDIKPVAEDFLESMVYKEFMPNTPTLCNAGRALQQLSACFVLPVEDYMATDDIGEDPEKQGSGIYDTLRNMAMIHKSGGGTGFNFSNLRPKGNLISTTFGASSGPISFIKSYDGATEAVNQGGFRRGANMAILNYDHPDIIEFISEKALNHNLMNFNLSVGIGDKFMEKVKEDGYYNLINPKNQNTVPLEERIWKADNILCKGNSDFKSMFRELNPSIIISEDKKTVLDAYTEQEIGKISEKGEVLLSARKVFDKMVKYAWEEGCPGIIFKDRLEKNNTTPHIAKIEATNPCGEQPLPAYEACNLGAVNLATCVKDGEVNYEEINRRVEKGVHFLDNVIDKSKFPFQKIYGMVHGNRRIGLGIMGWAEMLTQLKIPYDDQKAISLAKKVISHITEKGREVSEKLAEERGVFPNWKGSKWDKEGKKVRNATITTIAPNGTTGMIADCTGGIEPYFKLAFEKNCMDKKKLVYRNELFVEEISKKYKGKELEKILRELDEKGQIGDIENLDLELRSKYKTSHEVSPENHVRMQSAFQSGIDNAVSKTVNLPNEATMDDVKKIYRMAYDEGCIGVTIFRDGSKKGVLSGIEKKVELIQHNVNPDQRMQIRDQALKYRVKRNENKDSLHVTITSDLHVDDKTNKAYFIPTEIFQERAPLGHSDTVSFQQSGIDRTEILKGPNPDYVKLIERWQSGSSSEEEGIGPRKIKSKEHAVGLIFEDCLLGNGVVRYDESITPAKLVNGVRKKDLRKVERETEEWKKIMSQVRVVHSDEELIVSGNHGKLGRKFVCERCGSEEYTFETGCNHPKCLGCGEYEGGGCG